MGRKKTPLLERKGASICLGYSLIGKTKRNEIKKTAEKNIQEGIGKTTLTRYLGTGKNKGYLIKNNYIDVENNEDQFKNHFLVNAEKVNNGLMEKLQKEIREKYNKISNYKEIPSDKYLDYDFKFTDPLGSFIFGLLSRYIRRLVDNNIYVNSDDTHIYAVYKNLIFNLGKLYDSLESEFKEEIDCDKEIKNFLNACVYYRKIHNMNKLNVFLGKNYGDKEYFKDYLKNRKDKQRMESFNKD